MKNFLLMLCIPAILISGGLKSSLLKSKRQNKPLMVLVTAEHCKYCSKMKRETLSNSDVKRNVKDFLFTKVDKTSLDAQKFLPNTRYTPTVYFISPKFTIVNSVKGYLNAYDFNMWVDDTRSKLGMPILSHRTKTDNSSRYVQPEKDSVWMYDIASAVDFASQTGKQIMIFVGSNKSKWSKKMEKTTLNSNKIKSKLQDFVWVKLNHGDKEAKAYGINPKYVPSVYFMRTDMSELAVAKGYFKEKNFLKWVKYAKSKI
ncbi:MAG TPA: thioredoxin family protein [Campylobacterales bacterium]|jgi:thioredoxin-related protein|nr:thioredoxin family protein [Arcobacter sp.]HHD81001.1 thioredoxin family protein [Campylobacterales bacterium]